MYVIHGVFKLNILAEKLLNLYYHEINSLFS